MDSKSSPCHLKGSVTEWGIEQHFCIKTNTNGNHWPKGDYCVYQYTAYCPQGFNQGAIYIDDEDKDNSNDYSGTLPEGIYSANTLFKYCCRNDGDPDDAIVLPTEDPFFLFPHSNKCQEVLGMMVTEEYLLFDAEDEDDTSEATGVHPRVDFRSFGDNLNPKIFYCYYEA